MRRRVELFAPEHLAVARINRTKHSIDRRADEDQIARRCDAAAEHRLTGHRNTLGGELGEFAERNPPRDVACARVHRNQLAPRRLRATVLVGGVPEAPALGRDLRHVRSSARRHNVLRKIRRLSTSPTTASTCGARSWIPATSSASTTTLTRCAFLQVSPLTVV